MNLEKRKIREMVWSILEEKGVARFPKPVYGRIPNFEGAEKACEKIVNLEEYKRARVVKVSPDSPQYSIRLRCLIDRKKLVMPTPRLREGFLVLDPLNIPKRFYEKAATIRGAFTFGEKVNPEDLPGIDFIVVGSVAVGRDGSRIGKGEGYGEIEYAILREYNRVGEDVMVATNIHDLQLFDSVPQDPYDVPVDVIATPTKLIRIPLNKPKPKGIIWELLDSEKLEQIPLLKTLKEKRKSIV
ncbi:MAG: 5-formyltetrahydrofolate cyclo-ligase [Thaumarchaeota archaeon]|jgi:5-formyltetrahydrofolate cyclo-ligase|nr:5-formyltetrahydrofolate cyclo-ligase [Candidatus Geocrenenecus arthurdayi]